MGKSSIGQEDLDVNGQLSSVLEAAKVAVDLLRKGLLTAIVCEDWRWKDVNRATESSFWKTCRLLLVNSQHVSTPTPNISLGPYNSGKTHYMAGLKPFFLFSKF